MLCITGKDAGPAALESQGPLKTRRVEVSLTRLIATGQHSADAQLVHYQCQAMREEERFASVVNDAFETTVKGRK